jgi:hypothetical protein
VICRLLKDETPMVRAGAAHALSQFPEHAAEFGAFIRQAATDEIQSLALAGMFWCLGALQDPSPEATILLDGVVRESTDARQAFAAAIALYRIGGEPYGEALPVYRQMAAAAWFAEAFLAGVPWDFSGEVPLDALFAEVEPDPAGATRTMLMFLSQSNGQSEAYSYAAIVHDLLQLNFRGGNWRECAQPTKTQEEVLRRLVETGAAWNDVKRLWFLIPNGATRISQLTPSDIRGAREEMLAILGRCRIPH